MTLHTRPITPRASLLRPVFLTAEWRHLAMLNYEIDPAILAPLVPPGAQLDLWRDKAFVSVVAFLFLNARLRGIPVPFHRNFEEVNLRFYVVRPEDHPGLDRRGVVFIRQIVPRRAVAALARRLYNQPFSRMPMRHRITPDPVSIEYAWRPGRDECRLHVRTTGQPAPPAPGSRDEFIAEHYFAYTRHPGGGCVEYEVEHAPWRIWQLDDATLAADVETLYGRSFAPALSATPASAFLAEGSAVQVRTGTRLC